KISENRQKQQDKKLKKKEEIEKIPSPVEEDVVDVAYSFEETEHGQLEVQLMEDVLEEQDDASFSVPNVTNEDYTLPPVSLLAEPVKHTQQRKISNSKHGRVTRRNV